MAPVAGVVWIWSLAQELAHAVDIANKKKKKKIKNVIKKTRKKEDGKWTFEKMFNIMSLGNFEWKQLDTTIGSSHHGSGVNKPS